MYDAETEKDIIVNNNDELIDLVSEKFSKLKDDKADLTNVLWTLGIGDKEDIQSAQLLDDRTANIISEYLYYKTDPTKAFIDPPKIWKESVIMLNDVFQQRLF